MDYTTKARKLTEDAHEFCSNAEVELWIRQFAAEVLRDEGNKALADFCGGEVCMHDCDDEVHFIDKLLERRAREIEGGQ